MKRRWFYIMGVITISMAAAWSLYQPFASKSVPPSRPLDQVVPEGALLYLETKDFSRLLQEWDRSPEKAKWLESETYNVFSESHLFLRLGRFYKHFATAAGVPPDTAFIADAAGRESALALYDIGKLEFLYITHLPSSSFLNSDLWQSRNKFQPRSAGSATFFTRKDEDSGQVVAFAVAGDYLLLATREDLVAKALQLLDNQPVRSIQQEEWFAKVVAGAPASSGDLRMVLNLEKIAVTPHFRSYWIQQNITDMQGYTSAVSDLYRQGRVYREERILWRKGDSNADSKPAEIVDNLLRMVPGDSGFYQATLTDPQLATNVVEQKILAPPFAVTQTQNQAPQVALTNGETGSEADLEIRIDAAPVHSPKDNSSSELRRQFEKANAQAYLVVQGTRRNSDNVLMTVPTAMVIEASQDWDLPALQQAVQGELSPSLTASTLGLAWREVNQAGGYFELDGLHPLQLAVRGRLLYISNQAEMLSAVLQARNTSAEQQGVHYAAGFNHQRERQNFYEVTDTIDKAAPAPPTYGRKEPRFFSQNITSFSRTLARLESEKVVVREVENKVFQTVTYQWSE
jgi:hypothetical protein